MLGGENVTGTTRAASESHHKITTTAAAMKRTALSYGMCHRVDTFLFPSEEIKNAIKVTLVKAETSLIF